MYYVAVITILCGDEKSLLDGYIVKGVCLESLNLILT